MYAKQNEAIRLELDDKEKALRKLLLDVAAFINPNKPSELRWSGGWVRDKLLGVGSHDIDLAINDMTGYQFGLQMRTFLQNRNRAEQYSIGGPSTNGSNSSAKLGGWYKIEANPEKSKHLETVSTKIFDLDVDLVNLRKETYTDESRKPQMEFGNPQEDCLRSDATINSMFYNMTTEEVEDFTGRGIADLRDHILRTPLEPYQTFKDDPLRILRLVRFASRLGYTIDEDAAAAMKDQDIRQALRAKITRERIGVEIEKMLKRPDPHSALALIDKFGLYDTIFVDPGRKAHPVPETGSWHAAYDCAQELVKRKHKELSDKLITEAHDPYLIWLLSTLVPYADAPTPETIKGKLQLPLATMVIKDGIKTANRQPLKAWDTATAAVNHFESIRDLKDRFLRQRRLARKSANAEDDPSARDTIGMAIRQWGSSWRLQVAFALMTEMTQSLGQARGRHLAQTPTMQRPYSH